MKYMPSVMWLCSTPSEESQKNEEMESETPSADELTSKVFDKVTAIMEIVGTKKEEFLSQNPPANFQTGDLVIGRRITSGLSGEVVRVNRVTGNLIEVQFTRSFRDQSAVFDGLCVF